MNLCHMFVYLIVDHPNARACAKNAYPSLTKNKSAVVDDFTPIINFLRIVKEGGMFLLISSLIEMHPSRVSCEMLSFDILEIAPIIIN